MKMDNSLTAHMRTFWDLEVLLLATVLDPAIKDWLFNTSTVHMRSLIDIAKRYYHQLFDDKPDCFLTVAFIDYLKDENNNPLSTRSYNEEFGAIPESESRTAFWDVMVSDPKYAQLSKLALRLESCVCNTAAIEMLFSEMGFLHNRYRNRLNSKKVLEITHIWHFYKSIEKKTKINAIRELSCEDYYEEEDPLNEQNEVVPGAAGRGLNKKTCFTKEMIMVMVIAVTNSQYLALIGQLTSC